MRRTLAVLVVLACTACGAAPVTPPTARESSAAPAPGLAITGYALADEDPATVERDAPALAEVGVDGVTVSEDGARVSDVPDDALSLLARTHDAGVRAELLVSNYSSKIQDFSPDVGARLLGDPDHVDAVVDQLVGYVEDQGWDGITLDLESLDTPDGPGLVALATALQDRLPEDATVSIDVMASTSAKGYHEGGYLLTELADQVDVVALMAYDQHGPTWTDAGPVGSLDWQEQALRALLDAGVPAEKVDLGTAGFGYTWPTEKNTGKDLTVAGARALVEKDGAKATWDDTAGEWTATLSDGTVLWWADAKSFAVRRDLAVREKLHGMALWRLGAADPLA